MGGSLLSWMAWVAYLRGWCASVGSVGGMLASVAWVGWVVYLRGWHAIIIFIVIIETLS